MIFVGSRLDEVQTQTPFLPGRKLPNFKDEGNFIRLLSGLSNLSRSLLQLPLNLKSHPSQVVFRSGNLNSPRTAFSLLERRVPAPPPPRKLGSEQDPLKHQVTQPLNFV